MLKNLAMGAMAGLAPGKAGQYLPLVIGGIQALRQMQQARAAKRAGAGDPGVAQQDADYPLNPSESIIRSKDGGYKKGGRVMKGKTANTKMPQIPKGKQIPMPMQKGGMTKKGC